MSAISARSRRSPTRRRRSCAALEPGGVAVLPRRLAAARRGCAQAAGAARVVTFGAAPERRRAAGRTRDRTPTAAMLSPRSAGNVSALPPERTGRHMAMNALGALLAAAAASARSDAGTARAWKASRRSSAAARAGRSRSPGGTALLIDESYNAQPRLDARGARRAAPATRAAAHRGARRHAGAGRSRPGRTRAARAPTSPPAPIVLFTCGPLMRHLFDCGARGDPRRARAGFRHRWRRSSRGRVRAGRCDTGQGQPRQPHEAGGRRPRATWRRRADAVQPRPAASPTSSSCSTCSATSPSARARRA